MRIPKGKCHYRNLFIMPSISSLKKPTNLSLDQVLLKEARMLGINLSQAAEKDLKQAVSHAREQQWRQENAKAIKSSNQWVEDHGLPLEQYRTF
jgi:antitoxin CcdA